MSHSVKQVSSGKMSFCGILFEMSFWVEKKTIFSKIFANFFVQILVLNEVAISVGWELAKKFGLEKQSNY